MGFRDNASTAPVAPAKPAAARPAAAAPAKPAAARPAATPVDPAVAAEAARMAARQKYTGLKPPKTRPLFLGGGSHRVKLLNIEKVQTTDGKFKKPPWYRITLEVLSSTTEPPGVTRIVRRKLSAESEQYVNEELFGLMMAAQGYSVDQVADFEAANEDWPLMLDAVCGTEAACAVYGENPLKDSIVFVEAYDAEKTDESTGKSYTVHNYVWSVDPGEPEEAA